MRRVRLLKNRTYPGVKLEPASVTIPAGTEGWAYPTAGHDMPASRDYLCSYFDTQRQYRCVVVRDADLETI